MEWILVCFRLNNFPPNCYVVVSEPFPLLGNTENFTQASQNNANLGEFQTTNGVYFYALIVNKIF